jgi:uncharacterized membrane protein
LPFSSSLYPVIIVYGLHCWGALGVLSLGGLEWLIRKKFVLKPVANNKRFFLIVLLFAAAAQLSSQKLMLYCPVIVSLTLLCIFAHTLIYTPSIIERIARLRYSDLPGDAVSYCRKVTIVWCSFFIFNAAVALQSIYSGSTHWWALYNGILSYVIIAALIGGEIIFRGHFVKNIATLSRDIGL